MQDIIPHPVSSRDGKKDANQDLGGSVNETSLSAAVTGRVQQTGWQFSLLLLVLLKTAFSFW